MLTLLNRDLTKTGVSIFSMIGLVLFGLVNYANAITTYPPGALLQPNDVTSSYIRDATIVNADVSTSAAISATKVAGGTPAGDVMLSNGNGLATSTSLHFATSTNDLYVLGGRVHATSTNFNGVNYTWPSADGSNADTLQTNGSGTLSWIASAPSIIEANLTSGESITAGNALFVATSTNSRTQDIATSGTNAKSIGASAGNTMTATSFTETTHVGKVTLWAKTVGSPTDSLRVSIQADTAGAPSGTTLAWGSIAAGSLTGSFAQYTITFNAVQPTNSATTYWIVVDRTGAINGTDYFQIYGDGANTYTGGTITYFDGAAWNNQAEDARISLVDNLVMGRVYQASAKYYNYSVHFLGFAKTTVASSTAVAVGHHGVAINLSGLTAGTWYYLSDTLGAVSSTVGTIVKNAGVAITTTTMLVKSSW